MLEWDDILLGFYFRISLVGDCILLANFALNDLPALHDWRKNALRHIINGWQLDVFLLLLCDWRICSLLLWMAGLIICYLYLVCLNIDRVLILFRLNLMSLFFLLIDRINILSRNFAHLFAHFILCLGLSLNLVLFSNQILCIYLRILISLFLLHLTISFINLYANPKYVQPNLDKQMR